MWENWTFMYCVYIVHMLTHNCKSFEHDWYISSPNWNQFPPLSLPDQEQNIIELFDTNLVKKREFKNLIPLTSLSSDLTNALTSLLRRRPKASLSTRGFPLIASRSGWDPPLAWSATRSPESQTLPQKISKIEFVFNFVVQLLNLRRTVRAVRWSVEFNRIICESFMKARN